MNLRRFSLSNLKTLSEISADNRQQLPLVHVTITQRRKSWTKADHRGGGGSLDFVSLGGGRCCKREISPNPNKIVKAEQLAAVDIS